MAADIQIFLGSKTGGKNISRVTRYATFMSRLPEDIHKSIFQGNKRLAQFVVRSAKQRAPRWSGNLRKSIHIAGMVERKRNSSIQILVGAPYGAAQELGYTPHFVPYYKSTGINRPGFGFFWNYMGRNNSFGATVIRHTPFMRPAVFKARSRMNPIYRKSMKPVFKRLGGL